MAEHLDIVPADMRDAVHSPNARAAHDERRRASVDADILLNLVIASLEERPVNAEDRLSAATRHSR